MKIRPISPALYAIVRRLLAASTVTPGSHPVLVSLLQFAGQPAGAQSNTERIALCRQWKALAEVFHQCEAAGVKDQHVREALPFNGLSFTDEEGWLLTSKQPMEYRNLVRAALELVYAKMEPPLEAFDFQTIEELRSARSKNKLPKLEAVTSEPARLEGRLLPGRRLVMSYGVHGGRVFCLLVADQFGRLTLLFSGTKKRHAMRYHVDNPPTSAGA